MGLGGVGVSVGELRSVYEVVRLEVSGFGVSGIFGVLVVVEWLWFGWIV